VNGRERPDDQLGKARTLRWLLLLMQPGIGLKRWLLLAMAGVLLLAGGFALVLSVPLSDVVLQAARTLTLSGKLPPVWRGVIVLAIGIAFVAIGAYNLHQRFLFGAMYRQVRPGTGALEGLSTYRSRRRGPKIVAIGGGTGLSTLLRGLKEHTENITAIVTVADDGGSSGRLRKEFGIQPPGDARQCLIALSDSEPLMEELMSFRFETGQTLEGHSMGNLLLAALTQRYGNLHEALQAAARLLAVKGRVVPSTLATGLVLRAETVGGHLLEGESMIGESPDRIARIWLDPKAAPLNAAVADSLREADAVVIGPGSLYTSVLPNMLVAGMREALNRSGAPKVFVCNVATQHGETDGLDAGGHLREFERHSGVSVTHLLLNARPIAIPVQFQQQAILPEPPAGFAGEVLVRDVVSREMPSRHDPKLLAEAVLEIARGPRTRNGRPQAALRA